MAQAEKAVLETSTNATQTALTTSLPVMSVSSAPENGRQTD